MITKLSKRIATAALALTALGGTAQAAPFLNSAPVYIGGSPSRVRSLYCAVKNVDTVTRSVYLTILDVDGGWAANTGGIVNLAPGQSTRLNANMYSQRYLACRVDVFGAPTDVFRASAFGFDYNSDTQFVETDVR